MIYSSSGEPTAALVNYDSQIIDYTLFWIDCRDSQEAYYLQAIINSQTLYDAVIPFMPKGQFGARHLQKHLWKLPIPGLTPAARCMSGFPTSVQRRPRARPGIWPNCAKLRKTSR